MGRFLFAMHILDRDRRRLPGPAPEQQAYREDYHMRLISALAASSMMAIALASVDAQAQDAAADASAADTTTEESQGGIADIVVTAQKREGRLQDIPIAVSAIGSDEIERRSVLSVSDLPALVPGVSVAQHAGYNRLFIRGIGLTSISNGQDPSVSFQVDGVVIGRPSAQLAAFFDIERIEVLRGPQGTLYGRNATGGSVNLITRRPTRELSGYFDVSYGNYDRLELTGALSGPVTTDGGVRARFAFQRLTRDGYGRNVTLNEDIDDQRSFAMRGTIEADLGENADLAITADYAREDDHNYAFHAFGPYRSDVAMPGLATGGTILANSRDVTTEVPTRNDRTFWGLSATLGVDVSDAVRIQSITGYRDSRRDNYSDPETTSRPIFAPTNTFESAEQFSQELQFLYDSERVKGVVGLFYYDEDLSARLDLAFPFVGGLLGFPNADFEENGTVGIKSYAAFTEWTLEPIDRVRLTAGLRYSKEKRDSVGTFTIFNFLPPPNGANNVIPIDVDRSWDAFTPKFGIDYRPNDDLMLYASATRGFKSGVLLVGNPNPPVNPETIWAYEAGFKSTLADRRVQFNASAFYYDFTDLQVNKIVGNSIITENAASARTKGFEVEFRAQPVEGISLNADLTYLDAKFQTFVTGHPARPELGQIDLSGNRLVNAPKWAANAGAEFDLPVGLPGRLSLRGDMAYSGRVYFTEFNELSTSQKAVATFDLSLLYESDSGWRASIFAKNIGNEKVVSNKFIAAAATGYAINGGFKAPRTYGVRVGYSF
jgi:iron complex outermembrane receptor protein